MIIDDEPDILAYLSAVLEDAEYLPCFVNSDMPVLKGIEMEDPDLLILDVLMPNRSGISIYREIRSSKDFRGLPVIMISGMQPAGESVVRELEEIFPDPDMKPPDGFLEKPVSLPKLFHLIGKLLD